MHTPQEIDVWYILPAIRSELAFALAKRGLKQNEIADKLGMTEAAVSQYLKKKRASKVKLPSEIMAAVKVAAESLAQEKDCHRYEVQSLLDMIRMSGFLCKVHRRYDKVPTCCNVCIQTNEAR
jgi:hypothetical protein